MKLNKIFCCIVFIGFAFDSIAQVQKTAVSDAINSLAGYVADVVLDKAGKSRCDYNLTESKWYPYEIPWHTGQAVNALLSAYKFTGNKRWLEAAKKGGNYWITMQNKTDPTLKGMVDATHGDFIGEDYIVFATVSDGTPGLYELSRVTKNKVYAEVATSAATWMLANMYNAEAGVCYDNIDMKTGEVLKEYSPFWQTKDKKDQKLFDVSRPNTEGWIFKDAYAFSGEQKFKDAFINLSNSVVDKQGPEGLWMQFTPNAMETHAYHPRFNLWYAEALIEAYKFTGDKKYLEAAAKTARTYVKAQQKDGTIYYDNFLDGKPPDKGSATGSAVAFAGIVWIELSGYGYKEFDPSIEKSVQWILKNRYSENHADPNLRGAVLETRTRSKNEKVWLVNRDIGSSFGLRFLVDYMHYRFR